ncbi:prepilin-type N-terminal cleavage/methylation domain-containing protein [Lysobacter sp. Root494]|uniref:type IV pilus modification PilV family protein n=1 Tax=Lysobacter sp. Root494 TaxID=1736549 RepID=UPI0006F664F5|nr:prepilin-type N-terminal cleavage/methylation domain-containing protein [Lysobacter sp. Root494]
MQMKTTSTPTSKQVGFSLIEVLIAVVVLATGLLALSALQGALVRNSADAKARSQVAIYAQSLVEAARQQGYGAIPTGNQQALLSTSTGNALTAAAQAMGVSTLSESTTIAEITNGSSKYKTIDLGLQWTDVTGAPRNIHVRSVVSPLLLSQNLLNELDPPTGGSYRPIVRRPSPVTEGMIPIAMGGGEDTAATNPKPELVGRNNDTLVSDTRFDLLTFNASEGLASGFARFDKRIETAMVGCTCQAGLDGFPTGGNAPEVNVLLRDRAYRPSYWDGTRYTQPVAAGVPTRSPDTSVAQSELCDVCCRDHDDAGATGPKFNPWSTTHAHYLNIAGSPATTGTFLEACRVIRVDGIWRVTPDPKVQDIALLPTQVYPSTTGSTTAPSDNNAATSALVSEAGKTNYVTFAYDFIKQFFYDKTALDGAALANMQSAAGLNNPEYVPIKAGDTRWLHARAVLTDYLEASAVSKIDKVIDDCEGVDTVAQAQCVLPYVPVATVNATELATWRGQETSDTGIVHTGTLALPTTLKNYAQAALNRFVSGLALVAPISPEDDDNPIKDEQTFALASGTRTGTWLTVANPAGILFGNATDPKRGFANVSGGTRFLIELRGLPYATDNNAVNDPLVNVGSTSPQPCNPENASRGGNPFECTTESMSGVTVAVGSFNYLKAENGNINNPCTGGTGKIGQGQAVCKAYALTGGTLVSGTAGKPSEVSRVILSSVTAGATHTLVFSAVSDVNAAPVCNGAAFAGWTCE